MDAINFPIQFEKADGPLIIDIARAEEAEEIMAFVEENFLTKQPLISIIEYDATPKSYGVVVMGNVRQCLEHPLSLTVREQRTGRLVAVRLNKLGKRHECHESKMPEMLITAMLTAIESSCNIFELYETDRALLFYIVAVSSEFGRLGLASHLYQLSLKMAVANGLGAAEVAAFSDYAARAAAKLGFTTLTELNYASFEYKGTTPLAGCKKLLDEHPSVRLMARRLP